MEQLKEENQQNIQFQDQPESQPQNQQPENYAPYKQYQNAVIFEPSSLLKNHFGLQTPYNWMDQTPIMNPYHHHHCCYFDQNYHRSHLGMSAFLGQPPPKPSFQTLSKTSDILNSTAFLNQASFSSTFPTMKSQTQRSFPIYGPRKWVVPNEQIQKSQKNFGVKVQQNSQEKKRNRQKRLKSKMKNQTKNIPKNYGKAMISFILSHLDWIESQFGIQKRQELVMELKRRKNSVNAIIHLKQLWTTSKYAKQFRVLSNLFLRKYTYAYIFNSRVSNYSTHIKYKYKLQEAMRSPGSFSRIKDY